MVSSVECLGGHLGCLEAGGRRAGRRGGGAGHKGGAYLSHQCRAGHLSEAVGCPDMLVVRRMCEAAASTQSILEVFAAVLCKAQ